MDQVEACNDYFRPHGAFKMTWDYETKQYNRFRWSADVKCWVPEINFELGD